MLFWLLFDCLFIWQWFCIIFFKGTEKIIKSSSIVDGNFFLLLIGWIKLESSHAHIFAVYCICWIYNWIYSITDYNPDRRLLSFSLGSNENRIEPFAYNFRHLVIGRIFCRLVPDSMHFKLYFYPTTHILLVPGFARGILFVMWPLAMEAELEWWAVEIVLTISVWNSYH